MYTIHSYHLPYSQEDFTLNFCWRSVNGRLHMRQFCHVFIARVPALYGKVNTNYTVSFESACLPGHFLRQKNYHFHLQKRDGTELFGMIHNLMISRLDVSSFKNIFALFWSNYKVKSLNVTEEFCRLSNTHIFT